ncbi:glycosyltransferase family protein [Paenibacillus soyae]|uniref:Glycosyltransferase family 1 protein n=1 Tax=Paenibacillus soyae TaxID=2969249 RepID=A0A9X2SB50_9BACL|nr:glycosyltransferase [Paenibacillus soyae]MCR2804442.1 glycosyltransferase family 1 protein [Paenibacillus soyae]
MKVLHLPYNPAGQMSSQALALRKAGVQASFCTYGESVYKYPTDIRSPIAHVYGAKRISAMDHFAREALQQYDLFHFHGGLTFSNSYQYPDLPLLEGKKKIMNFWGSEVRRLSIAETNNPYIRVKLTDEAAIEERLKKLSAHFEHVIVPDYEIFEYVNEYFENVHIIRYVVDHEGIVPHYPAVDSTRPLIVHAPSEPYLKGTEFVCAAIEQLKTKADFDFRLVQNMPHSEAMALYKDADIIVDQLCLGVYSILSIESMLHGKPVITYIRDDLRERYPADLPVVSANPDTIEETLLHLLQHPEERYRLGVEGREYAVKHHSPEKIAQELLEIYSKL